MKIIRNVIVKQVLTSKKRATILKKLEEEAQKYNREIKQLTFLLHKAIRDSGSKHEEEEIRARYMKDIKQREASLESVTFQIQQMDKLELGTEILEGTVESFIEIHEGDRWPGIESRQEIVVKDGIVQEIRESRNDDD
ncbi:YlqD family protein [Alkalihalobacillus sp. MEB130]|uniref:YlqD family protein n=1 Tax=Alkalihalobacillus sp. MEB130 TaxID=2976704 RepID=UPI0028E026B5|nr:YlqD family protein [Alkalihalobacillus sp. MEB130]MDT8859051.1 YlqD family protein [Alkalihalobacillus sp. MEB130]